MATVDKIEVNSGFDDSTNCYIIYDPDNLENFKAIIIDPGGSPKNTTLVNKIKQMNIQLKHIVLTHGHTDHWLEVIPLVVAFTPDVWMCGYDLPLFGDYAIDRMIEKISRIRTNEINLNSNLTDEERDVELEKLESQIGFMKFIVKILATKTKEYINKIIIDFQKPRKIGDITFEIFYTPGHSPGGISLYTKELDGESHKSNHEGIIFSGDLVFDDKLARTDIPFSNLDCLRKSLKNRIIYNSDIENFLIYPGHSNPLTINHAKSILFKNVMRDFFQPETSSFTA